MASVVAIWVLAANTVRFPFLWDDFDFIGRALDLHAKDLLPDPALVFYRPVSRELYFWVVTHILGTAPLAAHVMQALIVAAIIVVLYKLVCLLDGEVAGGISALVFAAGAGLPLALGWISAAQDLLCTLFVVVALYFGARRKYVLAAAATGAALLSKETAAIAMPLIAAVPLLNPSRDRREFRRSLVTQVCVGGGWILVHPWTRSILFGTSNPAASGTQYVGFRGAGLLPGLAQGMAMTLNWPWVPGATSQPVWAAALVVAGLLVSAILGIVTLRNQKPATRTLASRSGISRFPVVLGTGVLVGSLVLTSAARGDWSPYYACLPSLGLAILAGPLLARTTRFVRVGTIALYLWLGIGLRGNSLAATVPSEPNFDRTARVLRHVEEGFKRLHASLPPSNVYLSVQTRGEGGLYRLMFRFQPLRVWYHEPGIWVLDPNRRRPGSTREYLFWIDPNLDVFEIRTDDLSIHGPSRSVELSHYQKTLRGYAAGLASAGEVDRAVTILIGMPEDAPLVQAFDRRTAAMLLYAAGRAREAERTIAEGPAFPPEKATEGVAALLAEPVAGLDLDSAAMRAFGLDPEDTTAIRDVMRRLDQGGFALAAGRFAARLLVRLPTDTEAERVLARSRRTDQQKITEAIPYDIPQ